MPLIGAVGKKVINAQTADELAEALSTGLTNADLEFLDGAIAGTAVASKALVADASKIISGLKFPVTARTATADGLTTGTIAASDGIQFITVTSANADHIVVLPAPVVGNVVVLFNGTTGYELRSSSPTTIGINGGTGADAESAMPASTTAILICETATAWKGLQLSTTAGTLAKVEVAA